MCGGPRLSSVLAVSPVLSSSRALSEDPAPLLAGWVGSGCHETAEELGKEAVHEWDIPQETYFCGQNLLVLDSCKVKYQCQKE